MVGGVLGATKDWKYEAITLGYPGLVKDGALVREPLNLGGSWMTFDFEKAFQTPFRIINDAAMQALANYQGGRMLFLGFGTSIGASLVAEGVIIPIELGMIPLGREGRLMECVTKEARKRDGNTKWQKAVHAAVALLRDVFFPDDTVVGGGNAKVLDPFPEGCRRTNNQEALRGAERLWEGTDMLAVPHGTTWRIEHLGLKDGESL
jgi:predicted NBD/HSP70 family sugar kinase